MPSLKVICQRSLVFLFLYSLDLNAQNDVRMLFKEPADNYHSSSPLGNGRLGAMVFGRTDRERIVLNEISMWSGGVQNADDPDAIKYLPQIRQLLLEGKNAEAQDIMQAHFICKGKGSGSGNGANVKFGCYQTLGDLFINWQDGHLPVQNYQRTLRLDSAFTRTSWQRKGITYSEEVMVSAPAQLIIVRLKASKPGALSFTARLHRKERAGYAMKKDQMYLQGILNSEGDEGIHYASVLKAIPIGGQLSVTDSSIVIMGANECILLVGANTDMNWPKVEKRGPEPLPVVLQTLNKAAGISWTKLLTAHIKDFQNYFNRCRLNFTAGENKKEIAQLSVVERLTRFANGASDPDLVNMYFNFGRYLLISSSRPGGMPANLQGLWADEYQTPWNGDYHTDINVQMNYWPAEVTNLAACHQPLFTLLGQMADYGSRTAKTYYGARGWVTHPITNPWGYTSPGESANWGSTVTGGTWATMHLWQHYLYNPDKNFLASVYPVIKGAAQFFTDILIEEPKHKWLVTAPSNSPENSFIGPNGEHIANCMGPTVDMQFGREILNEAIESATILNIDKAWSDSLRLIVPRLAPLQISPSTGALQEWLEDYKEAEPEHRHTSHLLGVYPLDEITPWGTPEFTKAAAVTLIRRKKIGIGWALALRMALNARMQNGNESFNLLRIFLTPSTVTTIEYSNGAGTYPNLFCAGPPFQIDGNLGATAGIAEMLMQSHGKKNIIRLLPALPSDPSLQDGSVKGLRARNGFEVSFNWQQGKVKNIKIFSSRGLPCNILLAGNVNIKDQQGKTIAYQREEGVIVFDTKRDTRYSVTVN
ncbi:MAG: glycoside hydrolase family 95 protein [Chitinophagaceae bacterium]|nr:glycoside hydrolase family 95 protein [Chitinophagaceae bacterium]